MEEFEFEAQKGYICSIQTKCGQEYTIYIDLDYIELIEEDDNLFMFPCPEELKALFPNCTYKDKEGDCCLVEVKREEKEVYTYFLGDYILTSEVPLDKEEVMNYFEELGGNDDE